MELRRAANPPLSSRLLAGITSIAFLLSQLALPPRAEASHLGSATASAGSAAPPAISAIQSFQPDLFTGRATTAIPIAVPPGRKGVQPNLALAYSSSGGNGWLGRGWNLDVGSIERSTKNGVPKYDASDTFIFISQNTNSELVKIPDGTYRAKDEGAFLRFENNGVSGWEVRDKNGTRYLFGQTVTSQIENGGQVFRWALEKVIDPNGNTVTYTYTKDQGQLYLARIDYTGHDPTSLAPTNQVLLTLEDRPDKDTSDRSGFPITTAKRLSTIETKATNGTLQLARRYVLAYTPSLRTGRSLLTSVTQVGADGTTSLPPTTLTYTDDAPTYLHCDNCVPSISSGNHDWQLQYQVGNLFPRDDGGNDQRLWPSGSFDPGQKCWSEQVCQDVKTCHKVLFWTSCDHQTVCQTVTNCAGISQVSWSNPILDAPSGSQGGISWSTDLTGNLSVSGPQDSHILAITWLYTDTAKTVSLSSLSTSGRADVFYVAPGGSTWSVAAGNQVPLAPGWTAVAVTAYNETGSFSLSMSANLVSQVTAMNHAQFAPMGLTGDFNGDGLADLAHVEPAQNHWHVALNASTGFGQEQTWLSATLPSSTIPLVGDVDADGKADLILWDSSSGLWQVTKSTGSSFLAPVAWQSGFGASQTPFMGDVNGDGFLDVGTFSGGTWTMALSNGTSFGSATTWLSGFGSGATPLTGDFNGDGLTDVAVASGGTISVALSDGSKLVPQSSAWTTSFGSGQSVTTADLNGDGLTDVVYYDKTTGTVVYAPSTGQGFGTAQTLMSSHPFDLRGTNDTFQVGDFRGNGLAGFGVFNALSGAVEIVFALGTPPDLLKSVSNGLGGRTSFTYQPSSQFTNTSLHFSFPIVTQGIVSDGLGHTYTTSYSYSRGLYDAPTKEFRGFQKATVTDAAGTTTTTIFSQDLHTKGRPLSVEVRDSAGHLFTKAVNTYSCTEPYAGVHFAKLDQTDGYVYDGDDTFRQVRSRFSYDAYGNLTTTYEDGQITPPFTGDERTTTTTFAYNTTAWILNKPSLIQTFDASGTTLVAQRRFYYDGATATTTSPTIGNLTKEEAWLNLPTEQWRGTSLTYDAYGNVKTVTDPLTRTTTNTYDATDIYLTQITNALGHTRQITYDPRFGAVISSTNENSQTTTTKYDTLGRVVSAIGPTDTDALPTINYAYDLSTVPTKTTVTTRIQSGQPEVLTAYAFMDGLGRTIQTRSPAEDTTKQAVSGAVEFDSRGLVLKQYVPSLAPLATSYVAPSSLLAAVTYIYDPVGRLTQITDPDGAVTSTRYDDGTVTVTDAKGHKTSRTADAYGRLTMVEDFTETDTYVTTYAYDALNNLTEVVDTRGNRTRVQYDSLGRKLSMDDPDMGHWTYAYDAVDNITSQTDARGVAITFGYDTLNRVIQKSYTIPNGSGITNPGTVTYTYDNPAKLYSKGKLTEIIDGSGSSSLEYDQLNRLVKESKTIDGTASTFQRSYDLLGRLTTLTYPDTTQAQYTYNAQGGIETFKLQQGATTQTIVSDVTYSATGQITRIAYGNGTATDYTYNPKTLRVDQLKSTSPTGTLQDFSYTFDPVGNVTAITDRVHTATQSFQYDALNRLTQATGSYGTLTYAYDPIGNMTAKEGTTMTYGLADGSKPHAVTSTSKGWTLTYDANGNLSKKTIDSRAQTSAVTAQHLSFDTESRLTKVETPQEATVTVRLEPGWNFFSLPVIPDDLSIKTIFPTFGTDIDQIARYNPTRNDPYTGHFELYVGLAKFDDFTTLDYGQGYQVYCTNPAGVTLTLKGKVPTQQASASLSTAWNLLPAIALDAKSVSWLLQGVAYDKVYAYNALSQQLELATQIQPNQAYYVNVTTSSAFRPPLPRDVTTSFVYDGEGGRLKKSTATGTTKFIGQGYEVGPDGKTTKYLFVGSQLVAVKDSSGATWFYHGDHLGSSNVITDANGTVVEVAEYTPYGSFSYRQGLASIPHKFTGQRFDAETGLYFYNARYYDPQLGRFVSPDTQVQTAVDSQALNRYSYAHNNPVRYVDPSGHFIFLAALLFVAATAAVTGAIGAAVSVVAAAATGDIHSFSDFAKAAGKGFVAGAAAGATGAVGALVMGPAIAGTLLGSIALGAGSGAVGGGVGSVLNGGSFGQGAGIGALTGGVLAGAGHVVGPYVAQTPFGQAMGKLTDPITSRLNDLYYQALTPRYSGIDGFLTKVQFGIHNGLGQLRNVVYPSPLSQTADRVTIYRGIGRGHPGFEDALKGVAQPRGGHIDPALHNAYDTQSEFTSWTTRRSVAAAFAEGDGVVLELTVDRSKLVPSPDLFDEGEVLIRGAVDNAQLTQP